MTFRGPAVTLSGMANTMNVDAPRDAMITASCRLRKERTTNTDAVAKRLCRTSCFPWSLHSSILFATDRLLMPLPLCRIVPAASSQTRKRASPS